MLRSAFVLVVLMACSIGITVVKAAGPPKDDAAAILGEWGGTAYTDNGEDVFGEEITPKESSVRWNIEKAKLYFLTDVEATVEGSYKLNATAKPRTIDIVTASPLDPEQKQRLKGIYELKGDELRVCYGPDGADRPKKFEAKEGSKLILIEFGRIKLSD